MLSSICWAGLGFGSMVTAARLRYAASDPHWVEILKPGHASNGIDDECARLAGMTPEQRAQFDSASNAGTRELWRRIVVHRARRLLRQP